MKILSRDFTTAEKILLAVLALILLGLVYYRFVDQNVRASITSSEAEYQQLRMELDALQINVSRLQGIQNQMDALEDEGNLSWMGSYNNSKEELKFLNDILADTLQYSVSFANVTRNGDQIRRSFTLQYTTNGYKAAQEIVSRLMNGRNRCLVSDLRCTINNNGTVTMSQSATFYETMVGGTPDAGLPSNSAAANS